MIKTIYTYLISAITLVMVIIGAITLISNALSLTTFTGYAESYEDFVRNRCTSYTDQAIPVSAPISAKPNAVIPMSTPIAPMCNIEEAIIKQSWKDRYAMYIDDMKASEKRQKMDKILKAIPLILVPLPVFFLFQRKREEK